MPGVLYRSVTSIILILFALVLYGCAKDRYQQRADTIKDYTSAFYGHLEEGRITDAVLENERIEALARDAETRFLRRVGKMDAKQKAREWMLVKTANETAAENWLALARYFVKKKQYEQARGAYQRVLETYQDKTYRSITDQAETGLRDLDLILNPSKFSSGRSQTTESI